MFTLTSSGMFSYDPARKLTRMVLPGVDWAFDSKWRATNDDNGID